MKAAKFPLHRDLAGFDFASSKVDEDLVGRLASLEFSDTAQNVVLIGGPDPGKTQLATAMAVSGIAPLGASACGSIPRLIWSTCWSRKKRRARPVGLRCR